MTDDRISPPPTVDALAFVAQVERARDATPCPPLMFDPAAISPEDLERMWSAPPGNIVLLDPSAQPAIVGTGGSEPLVVAEFDPSGRLVHAYGIPAKVLAKLATSLREAGLDPAGLRLADIHWRQMATSADPLAQRDLSIVLSVAAPGNDAAAWVLERRRKSLTPERVEEIVTDALRREIHEGVSP